MGRTEPTIVKAPAAFRRDARAKRARTTLNRVIPAMLSAHPQARWGVERSELVVNPPALSLSSDGKRRDVSGDDVDVDVDVDTKPTGRRKKRVKDHHGDEKLSHGERSTGRRTLETAYDSPRITLCIGDALTVAQTLLSRSTSPSQQHLKSQHQGIVSADASGRRHKRVGVLNMASPLAPGGGFLNGATGPEASLCLRTTLLPALRDEFYRLPELGVVYTPDVLVFRPTTTTSTSSSPAKWIEDDTGGSGIAETDSREDDILPKNDRWFVDVASAAMLRLPETISSDDEDGRTTYALASDRELARSKMRAVLRVFASRGCDTVVLGAWGCGVHEGNPVSEIAAAWRQVLGIEAGHHQRDSEDKRGYSDLAHPSSSNKDEVGGKGRDKKKTSRNKGRENAREPWGAYISDVVFAIKDRGTATAFARAFGEDCIPALPASSSPTSSAIGDDEEDPVEVARVRELSEKIAQLEMQCAQARSSHLKAGLESVLAGLKRQLPSADKNDGDGDTNDNDEASSSGRAKECSSETEADEVDDDDCDDDDCDCGSEY